MCKFRGKEVNHICVWFKLLFFKGNSTKNTQIVVVNAANNNQILGDPKDDEDYKRIKVIF